jgi:acetyl esterase/lipase
MTTIAADVVPQSAPEGTTILRLPSVWKFSMVSALNGPSPNLKTPPPAAMAAMRTAVEPQQDDRDWSDYQDNTGAGWEKQGAENPLGLGVLRQRIHTPDLTSQTHWYLVIPGVDEDVWAYINGELVAEQSWANTGMTPDDLWNYPLVAELTGKLASDTDVLLALGIFNRAGMGGLYTSVYLVGADRELTAGEAVTVLSEGNPYGYATLFRRKFAASDQTGKLVQAVQDNWTPYRKSVLEKRKSYDVKVVSYGDHPQQEIYLSIPKQKSEKPFPVLVWYHGGGLTADGSDAPAQLWNGLMVIAEVRYRTSGVEFTALDCLEDAGSALAWVLDHLEELGAAPSAVFIGGISAGGWLSAMIGMNPNLLALHNHSYHELAGLILVTGQMTTHFQLKHDLGYKRLGATPVLDEYAPIYWISPDVPPLVCITGSDGYDMPGRPAENAYMVQMLKTFGHPDATHIVLEGFTHAATGQNCGYSVLQFIDRILKKHADAQ